MAWWLNYWCGIWKKQVHVLTEPWRLRRAHGSHSVKLVYLTGLLCGLHTDMSSLEERLQRKSKGAVYKVWRRQTPVPFWERDMDLIACPASFVDGSWTKQREHLPHNLWMESPDTQVIKKYGERSPLVLCRAWKVTLKLLVIITVKGLPNAVN